MKPERHVVHMATATAPYEPSIHCAPLGTRECSREWMNPFNWASFLIRESTREVQHSIHLCILANTKTMLDYVNR